MRNRQPAAASMATPPRAKARRTTIRASATPSGRRPTGGEAGTPLDGDR